MATRKRRDKGAASNETSEPVKRRTLPAAGPIDHYNVFKLDGTLLTQLPGGIAEEKIATEIRRQFGEDRTFLVRYQPMNAAGKFCGPPVVTEIIGHDELETMQDEVEPLDIETLPDGKVTLTFKDGNDLKSFMGARNGQPEAAPATFAGIDPGAIKSLGESYQAIIGVQTGLLKSASESMKTMAESRPAPAPVLDPNLSPAVVEMRTRLDMMEKMVGMAPDKQDAMLKLMDKVWPSEDDGFSWSAVIKGVAAEAMPLLTTIAQMLLIRFGGQAQASVATAPGQAPPALGQLPGAPLQPTGDPADLMLQQIAREIHFAINNGQSVSSVADSIERLQAAYPNSQQAAISQNIVLGPVEEIVKNLGLVQPGADNWIKNLQMDWKIRREEDAQDAEQAIMFEAPQQ